MPHIDIWAALLGIAVGVMSRCFDFPHWRRPLEVAKFLLLLLGVLSLLRLMQAAF